MPPRFVRDKVDDSGLDDLSGGSVTQLVEAGAPVADPCPCADHESALVTAVNIGATDVARWPEALPEGFDARITFDPARARARLWPAIDPDRTSARSYPDSRHEHLDRAARDALVDYTVIDPAFVLPDTCTFDDPAGAQRAQALVRYLAHSFRPFELFSALPAADTAMAEVLDVVVKLRL